MRLRPATAQDVAFLRRVFGTTREEEMARVPWTAAQKEAFLDQQFLAQKTHYEDFYPDCQFLVIEREGEPIGRLYIERGEADIAIVDISLLPEHCGQGVGGALLGEILAEAAAAKRAVQIYVEHFNPARRLYDRLGFVPVGTNGIYHHMEWRAEAHAVS